MTPDVIERLSEAVQAFVRLASRMPDEPSPGEEWGVREVTAHLVFWHEHYVSLLRVLFKGDRPLLPVGKYRELNALAVRQNSGQALVQMLERFQAAESEVERLVPHGQEHDLRISFKEGSKARTMEQFAEAVAGHIEGHRAKLQRRENSRLAGR